MNKEKNVTIFFTNGGTARFEEVTEFRAYGSKLEFEFTSQSDGVRKTAVFDHNLIAGITKGKEVEYKLRNKAYRAALEPYGLYKGEGLGEE